MFIMERLLQEPEQSDPIYKKWTGTAGAHCGSRRNTSLSSSTKWKPTRDGNGREVTKEKQRHATWSLQSSAGTGWYRMWRVTRRTSTTTSAVKAKGNKNSWLSWVGDIMKDTEKGEVFDVFLALGFNSKVCHPGLWAYQQNSENGGGQRLN